MRYSGLSTGEHIYSPDVPPCGTLGLCWRYETLSYVAKQQGSAIQRAQAALVCLYFGKRRGSPEFPGVAMKGHRQVTKHQS